MKEKPKPQTIFEMRLAEVEEVAKEFHLELHPHPENNTIEFLVDPINDTRMHTEAPDWFKWMFCCVGISAEYIVYRAQIW